jgi:hypothetical protein
VTVDGDGDGAELDPPAGLDPGIGDDDQDALRRDVAKLGKTVRALAGTVARLAGADPTSAGQPDAGSGTDADGKLAGEDLVAWVQWLVARYELDNIPDCWTCHGALVEELDALRIGWLDTIGKGQGGLAGMQWHDYFGRTLERFDRRWRARNCEDTHRETILPAWVTNDPRTPEAPELEAGRYCPPPP